MARTKISEFSATAADNTDIDNIDIAEGCAPSGINNAIRELMAQLKDFQTGSAGDPFNGAVNGTVGATTPAAGTFTNLAYTGTLTGGTGIINIGSGQVYKDASGNVGIGTSSPGYQLNTSKAGGVGDAGQLVRFTNTSTGNSLGPFHLTIGTANYFADKPGMVLASTNSLGFAIGDGSDLANQRKMTLDSSGNLGLGTTTPTTLLQASLSSSSSGLAIAGSFPTVVIYDSSGTTGTGAFGQNNTTTYLYNKEAGPLIFGTGNNERARIDSNGNWLVGFTSKMAGGVTGIDISSGAFSGLTLGNSGTQKGYLYATGTQLVLETASGNTLTVVSGGSGGVSLANGATSWAAISDERNKDIIEPIADAASKVSSLRAVIGKYNTDEEGTRRSFLIAQDVDAVLPEAVDKSDPDNWALRYTEVVPLLVAAISEIKAEFDAYKAAHP